MPEPRTVSLGRAKEVKSMEAAWRPLRSVLDHSSRWSIQDLVQKTVLPKLALFHTHVAKELQAHNRGLPRHTLVHSYPGCLQTRFALCVLAQDLPMPCCNASCPQGQSQGCGIQSVSGGRALLPPVTQPSPCYCAPNISQPEPFGFS